MGFANSLRLDRKRSRHLSRLPARSALLPCGRGLHRRPAPSREEAIHIIRRLRRHLSRLPARSALLPCGFIMPSEIWSFYSLPFALLPISSPKRLASSSTGRASVLRPPETRALKGKALPSPSPSATPLPGGEARELPPSPAATPPSMREAMREGDCGDMRHGCIRALRDYL